MTMPTTEALREHYAKTALARMGIPFERGMQIESVRLAVEGAARRAGKASPINRRNVALRVALVEA